MSNKDKENSAKKLRILRFSGVLAFVGTFILQISNGKTIRQMILGTIFIGSFATFIHFYVLGGLTLNLYERGVMDIPEMVKTIPSGRIALEALLTLPGGYFLIILYAFIATIFLCTTYDSCSYVLASTAMKHASKRPTKSLRLIFAFLLIIQPILIMSLEGIDLSLIHISEPTRR